MTRVPVSKKHTSSNESTKLVDETSSSYTYIHIHAHTFLSISPVHRSKKKKKKKRIKEHTQASMCMLEKKKKEKLLLKLLHASYTRVYTICACISTSLLLLIDCSSSHLRENCFYLDWRTKRKKKKRKNRIERSFRANFARWLDSFAVEIRAEIPRRQKAFSSRESCLFEARTICINLW